MFIYESGNSLNLTFKGSIPVVDPEIVIKGYKDGATLTVDGTTYGSGSEEFEGKAKTLVYQKNGLLNITFKGVEGINNPEVTIDERQDGIYDIVVGGEELTISVDGDSATVIAETVSDAQTTEVIEEPVKEDEVEPESTGEDETLEDPIEE